MNPEEIVPEGAFAGVPRLRHVSVEAHWSRGVAKLSAASHCQTASHCSMHFRQRLSLLQTTKQCLGSWLPGIWIQSLCGTLLLIMGVCIGRGSKLVQQRNQARALPLSRMHQPS